MRINVFGNLIRNSSFNIAPAFTAATTSSGQWINGAAGGSSAQRNYEWGIVSITAAAEAAFDSTVTHSGSYSMRLSTTNATGVITVANYKTVVIPVLIPLAPSTTYTLTGWVKTNNAATNSVFVDVREFTPAAGVVATNSSNKLSGTNDWTTITATFTTGATTRCGAILLRNNVAGNVSDAWFDDLVLTRSTATTRSAA